jgi:hypothetical protein
MARRQPAGLIRPAVAGQTSRRTLWPALMLVVPMTAAIMMVAANSPEPIQLGTVPLIYACRRHVG